MTEQLIECDDHLLLAALHGEDDELPQPLARHLEQCVHCQTRLTELAATEDRWQKTAAAFSDGDGQLHPDESDVSPRGYARWTGRSINWDESMIKQLLDPPSHPEMLGRLGRYEIECLIGSGGMGIVFKAYDTELHRPVAIKILAPYLASSGSARQRFAREARSAAGIVDDHVVPIHNVESEHQPPFLVMQYVAGGSLQEKLDRHGPLDVVEIVRIGIQTAKGLAAAHAQGLIHRDVKPSNILLDEGVERALLTDFGLARTEDDACLTRSGFQPGTPHYMSPEQVRGETLDGRSDLFSLGCVLYALCTGRPPFRADSGYAVLRRITDDTPRPIREINSGIPEWLEQIVMKLLEKDRDQRFGSAEEVANTLSQWLAHVQQPHVVPAPAALTSATSNQSGNKSRWMKYLLGAAASLLLLLLWAGVVIVLETNKGTLTIESEVDDVPIRIMRGDDVIDRLTVSQSGESIRVSAGMYLIEFVGDVSGLTIDHEVVSLKRGQTEVARIVRSDHREQRSVHPAVSRTTESSHDMPVAGKITVDLYGGADVLTRMNSRHPSETAQCYNKLLLTLNSIEDVTTNFRESGPGAEIRTVIVSDPSLLCAHESQRTGRPSDLQAKINAALETAGITSIRWEQGQRKADSTALVDSELSTETSPNDGDESEIPDLEASVLPSDPGDPAVKFDGHGGWPTGEHGAVRAVAFHPDGKRIASGGVDRVVRVWDAADGREVFQLKGHQGQIESVKFSPDGKRLASVSDDRTVKIWDAESGKELRSIIASSSRVLDVDFSPDGIRFAWASLHDRAVSVWDLATGKPMFLLEGRGEWVECVAYSPDGKWVAAGFHDGTIELWDALTGENSSSIAAHEGVVKGLSFSPDSKLLASFGVDGKVSAWDVTAEREVFAVTYDGMLFDVDFRPDGKRIVTATSSGMVNEWDVASGSKTAYWTADSTYVHAIAYRPDGKQLAAASSDGLVRVWNIDTRLGLWGGNSKLSQVQDAIRKVRSMSYTVTHTTGSQQEIAWVVKVLGEDLCRVEQPNGIYLIFDVKGKRIMEVDPTESKVRITENLPVPGDFNSIAMLANVKALAAEHQPELPVRAIDGKEATGFAIEENGVQINVWIDPATNLPLEMQRHSTPTQENTSQAAETWSDFRFDEPMDKSLFAFEVPEGFAVGTNQPAAPKTGTSKSYGFGPDGRKTKAPSPAIHDK